MIKNLTEVISKTVDKNEHIDFEALSRKSIINIMLKINELVDKVNTLEAEKDCSKVPDTQNNIRKPVDCVKHSKEPRLCEWVAISEKHPTKTGSFLFSFGGELVIAFYKAEIKEIELPSGMALSVDEIQRRPISVHWMPLPEPPSLKPEKRKAATTANSGKKSAKR